MYIHVVTVCNVENFEMDLGTKKRKVHVVLFLRICTRDLIVAEILLAMGDY